MTVQTKFLYKWDNDVDEEGLTEKAHDQLMRLAEAIQTKGNIGGKLIEWPAEVLVGTSAIDMTPSGFPDQVGVTLRFVDLATGREIVRFEKRYPKAGLEGVDEVLAIRDLKNPKN